MAMSESILLTRDNYKAWNRQITHILQSEGLYSWVYIETWPQIEKVTNEVDKFKLLQSKQRATGILKTYVTPDIELVLGHLDCPAEIWETLKLNFELEERSNKLLLINEFRNLRITLEEDLPSFIARFEDCYRRV